MAKTAQNLPRKFKITDFLLGSGLRTGDFFVGIGVLHVSTEFHTCMWNIAWGALRWNFIGGAIEPFCHTHFRNPYEIKIVASSGACAKFNEFSSIFMPSKMRFILKKKKLSNSNRVLTPSVLGP